MTLGIARGTLAGFRERLATKVRVGTFRAVEAQVGAQHRFAESAVEVDGAELLALRDAEEMERSVARGVAYSARGFLLALGCIQALQCNRNTCPVGITTHQPHLQKGLDIDDKAQRVANYIEAVHHDHIELLAATGRSSTRLLTAENVYLPENATATSIVQELT